MPRTKIAEKKEFRVSHPHNALLEAVYKYQLATIQQLLLICGYSPKSLERVQRLAKQLTDNEYLLAYPRPVIRGHSPLVYTLAKKGLNYLESFGCDVRAYFRPSKEMEKSYLFLNHTLALNDVLISAANFDKFAADYSLSSFTHERTLKQTPYKAKFEGLKNGSYIEEIITLVPDALLDFRQRKKNGREEKIPVIYEQDMGTIEQKNFRKKIRAYILRFVRVADKEGER